MPSSTCLAFGPTLSHRTLHSPHSSCLATVRSCKTTATAAMALSVNNKNKNNTIKNATHNEPHYLALSSPAQSSVSVFSSGQTLAPFLLYMETGADFSVSPHPFHPPFTPASPSFLPLLTLNPFIPSPSPTHLPSFLPKHPFLSQGAHLTTSQMPLQPPPLRTTATP